MNGRPSSYDTPSIVTCCSCMHSSSAACVFGDARLISSTSRRFANTGPGRNSNSFERWLKTLTPVTSEGRRSGVNCMRENETSRERASAFASIVLPTPGKSSRIRWPSLIRQRTHSRSVSSGACSTRARLSTSARTVSAASVVSTRSLPGSLTQQLLRPIYDRRGDSVFRRLRESLFSARGDEHDLVLVGVEADVCALDVVVDDEVDMLPLQLRACAREVVGARFGGEADDRLVVRAPLGERLKDVGSRLELQPPRLCVLRALRAERLGGAGVPGRGGQQEKNRNPGGPPPPHA